MSKNFPSHFRILLFFTFFIAGFVFWSGCSSSPTVTASATPTPTPTATPTATASSTPATTVSYTQSIQTIWDQNCTSCHVGGGQGGLTLTSGVSFKELTEGPSSNAPVVIANNANGSFLIKKLSGDSTAGTRMPVGGALSESDIQKVKDWINQGAQNN